MLNVNKNITNWDKKIVYAPNAFGKTTASKFLYDYYVSKGERVEIFTRKNIEELVANFGTTFYLGKNAIAWQRKAIIDSTFKSKEILSNLLCNGQAKSGVELKKHSFYCAYNNIKNNYEVPINLRYCKNNLLKNYGEKDILNLDNLLSYDLYKDIEKELIDKVNPKELEDITADFSNCYIDEDIMDKIKEIYLYSKLNKVSKCYLCGKKYKGHNQFLTNVENRINELECSNKIEINIMKLYFRLEKIIEDNDNFILNDQLKLNHNCNIRKKYTLLLKYRKICQNVLYNVNKYIFGQELEFIDSSNNVTSNKIEDVIKEKIKLNNKLSKAKITPQKALEFNKFVIDEIKNNIKLDSSIIIEPLKKEYGLNFKINKTSNKPYDILSESELKRLSLIVLKAEIKYRHLKTIILDDPIDSYDDYNKRIACQYISEFISKRSLNHWYIFTNDYECVYYLSNNIRKNTIFCLDDINEALGYKTKNIEIECSPCDISILTHNDIYFLTDFVKTTQLHYKYDKDVLFCALTLTLRNFGLSYINEMKTVMVDNKDDWVLNIRGKIEKCAEHYDVIESETLKIMDIAELYFNLNNKSRKSYPSSMKSDSRLFANYREQVALDEFNYGKDYTTIVNYIFKKILIINYYKYQMEKKLMILAHKEFSTIDFDEVNNEKNGLFKRIEKAMDINTKNSYKINDKLNKFIKVHKQFSTLYNSIDHGTDLSITPYLSISVLDITKFISAVNAL